MDDPVYRATRAAIWSKSNPYFFTGTAAEGIGSPHIPGDYIWPMSLIVRALTNADDAEIKQSLNTLKATTAGTHFIHESFHMDEPCDYTRPWFAWANTLFGELVLDILKRKPDLLV
jgi:meiotically up-regulated gene 157 (Mug157) protein